MNNVPEDIHEAIILVDAIQKQLELGPDLQGLQAAIKVLNKRELLTALRRIVLHAHNQPDLTDQLCDSLSNLALAARVRSERLQNGRSWVQGGGIGASGVLLAAGLGALFAGPALIAVVPMAGAATIFGIGAAGSARLTEEKVLYDELAKRFDALADLIRDNNDDV